MATSKKLGRENVAKSVRRWNKKRFTPIVESEGINFDALIRNTKEMCDCSVEAQPKLFNEACEKCEPTNER